MTEPDQPDQPDGPGSDRLILDITPDLERVDPVMSRIVGDPVIADEFIRDPSGVLTRLGLHPRTTRDIHDRVNQVFYAVLTNTELLELLAEHYRTFGDTDEVRQAAVDTRGRMAAALERGQLDNSLDFDLAGFRHLVGSEDVLRRAFQLMLHDLNNRRILMGVYSSEEINQYVDEITLAIRERRPIREFPVLEEWDANYGIGKGQGGLFLEVGPVVTAVAVAEVHSLATIWVSVEVDGDIFSRSMLDRAAVGDPRAARALATTGALFRIAGEMILHANNFERRPRT